MWNVARVADGGASGRLDYAEVEAGIPLAAVTGFVAASGVELNDIYDTVIPARTLKHRRARREPLSRDEGDKLARLVRIFEQAETVWGSKERAGAWLHEPKRRFEGRTPMQMLRTEVGGRLVEEMLGQIQSGLFAQVAELWRISEFGTLTGEGGLRYAGRWHSAGRPVVYLAESPAGALIEVLVHLELQPDALPPAYTLLRVAAPAGLAPATLELPPGEEWKADFAITRRLGDRWLAGAESALARVPSVLLPNTSNVLLNPLHRDAGRVTVEGSTRAQFDARLLRYM